ncbi:unnamed protein product [Lymnaea stagnalis]|uniref:Uncharacterized protein n=1 Tax=Lymnaea stagnalis TaxID=6523 RepID=A0AAV2IHJ0_LYMST
MCDVVSVVTIGRVDCCQFFILVCDSVEQVVRLFKQLVARLQHSMFGAQVSYQATEGCAVKPLPDLLQDLPRHRAKPVPSEPDLLTSPGVTRRRPVNGRRGHPSQHPIHFRHHRGSSYPGSINSHLHWCQLSRHFIKHFGSRLWSMCGQLDPLLAPLVTSAGLELRPHALSPAEHIEDRMGYVTRRCDAARERPGGVSADSENPATVAVDSTTVTSIVHELRKIGDDLDMRMSSEKEPQAQMAFWNFKRQFGYDLAMTLTFQHVVRLVGAAAELCYLLSRL